MKSKLQVFCWVLMISVSLNAQNRNFEHISFVLGEWEGEGTGFGNEKSTISSSFKLVMTDQYIEVINQSKFEPTDNKPEGELHEDKGFISFDKMRNLIVFRQFNIEGYVNTYLLIDSLSNENTLVFQTEAIENFMPGGKAQWTIKKIDKNQIKTVFDVSFPNQGYTCFGTNRLQRIKAM